MVDLFGGEKKTAIFIENGTTTRRICNYISDTTVSLQCNVNTDDGVVSRRFCCFFSFENEK